MPITEQEYRERKDRLHKRREILARELQIIDERLKSWEIVWFMVQEDEKLLSTLVKTELPDSRSETRLLPELESNSNGPSEKFSLIDEVNNVTKEIKRGITQPSVTKVLQERFPDENIQGASVSNRLSRLSETGELTLVKKGIGSQPGVYERTDLMSP